MVKCVIHYDSTSTAGVENVEVGILDTWATVVRGGECTSVKWGGIDWFVFATSSLMDYTIFEGQVLDILGCAWACVLISVDEGIVSRVAKIELHPVPSWMVVICRHFCLCLDVNSDTLQEGGRWSDFLVGIFEIWSYHLHKYWDEGEVRDLVEDIVGSG